MTETGITLRRGTADDIRPAFDVSMAAMTDLFSRHRDGHVYRRDGRAVGFAFVSADGSGPVVALEPPDQVPILRHAEGRAHDLGLSAVSFEVPMPNEIAMRHLLGRGFRIEPPLTLLMSSVPFGKFDRFLPFGPSAVL